MMYLETMNFYECEILEANKYYMEKYIGYGWYEYVKEKKLKVGDVWCCTYRSTQQMLYVS